MKKSALWVAILLSTGGCISYVSVCAERYGDCPPPNPGLYVETLPLSKSTWFDSESFGGTIQSLCTGDARARSGTEVVIRTDQRLLVIEHVQGQPARTIFVPATDANSLELYDFNLDGNAEYVLEHGYYGDESTSFHAANGSLIFSYPKRYLSWQILNLGNDDEPDFAVFDDDLAQATIWNSNGQVIATFANLRATRVLLANIDNDPDIEFVLVGDNVANGQHEITAWKQDGSFVAAMNSEPPITANLYIAALPEAPERHYLALSGQLHDVDGVVLDTDESRWLSALNGVTCLTSDANDPCLHYVFPAVPAEIELNCPFGHHDNRFPVLFSNSQTEHTAHIQNSVIITRPVPDLGLGLFNTGRSDTVRTIIRIYSVSDTLLYHEVLDATNPPGSFAVIDGTIAGRQGLLVADDARVLLYEISE